MQILGASYRWAKAIPIGNEVMMAIGSLQAGVLLDLLLGQFLVRQDGLMVLHLDAIFQHIQRFFRHFPLAGVDFLGFETSAHVRFGGHIPFLEDLAQLGIEHLPIRIRTEVLPVKFTIVDFLGHFLRVFKELNAYINKKQQTKIVDNNGLVLPDLWNWLQQLMATAALESSVVKCIFNIYEI